MDWRRSQAIRRELSLSSTLDAQAAEAISDENKRVRAAAWTAYYRVRLLCGDVAIEASARGVIEKTRSMKRARNRPELDRVGDEVRQELMEFLDVAARQTGADPASRRTRRLG